MQLNKFFYFVDVVVLLVVGVVDCINLSPCFIHACQNYILIGISVFEDALKSLEFQTLQILNTKNRLPKRIIYIKNLFKGSKLFGVVSDHV